MGMVERGGRLQPRRRRAPSLPKAPSGASSPRIKESKPASVIGCRLFFMTIGLSGGIESRGIGRAESAMLTCIRPPGSSAR